MEDRMLNKWLRRRFSAIGWTLLVYNLLLNVLVIATVIVDMASQTLKGLSDSGVGLAVDMDAILGNAWGYILAIVFGMVILYGWKGRDYWKREILKKEKPMKLSVLLCMLVLMAGAQMVNSLWVSALEAFLNLFGKSALELLESVSGNSDTFSMFVYASVLAPLSEEILFRGYVLRALRPYGKRFSILLSAVLFAAFHGNLLQAPYAFLAGLVLGYAAAEYSILWAVVLHVFNNFVLADLLTRLFEQLPAMAADIISWVLFGGCAVASIVILVAKRKEVSAYRKEWIDRRCLKCFFSSLGILALLAFMAANMLSLFIM